MSHQRRNRVSENKIIEQIKPGRVSQSMGYPAGLFSFSAMKEVKHIRQSSKETMPLATKEEIEIAKDTDLPDLLTYMGYSVKRIGQYYTTREMDSLRIKDRRTWTRYSTRQRGDAITL